MPPRTTYAATASQAQIPRSANQSGAASDARDRNTRVPPARRRPTSAAMAAAAVDAAMTRHCLLRISTTHQGATANYAARGHTRKPRREAQRPCELIVRLTYSLRPEVARRWRQAPHIKTARVAFG